MKWIALAALLATGCTHGRVMKDVSDCDPLTGEDRLACSACTIQNKAQGWIGLYEYRPDADAGSRCVRVK